MAQVPFVAVCAHGHLDDFPFGKWVHHSHKPSCNGTLRLNSRGAGGLEGQVVTCDACQRERPLAGIMDGHRGPGGEERTTLTDQLAGPDDPFWCPGARPWLAAADDGCGQPIRAALRAAGNVYFPRVESSIYLPRKEGAVSAEMHDLLRSPQVGPRWSVLHDMLGDNVPAAQLRKGLVKLFAPYSDEELIAAFHDLFGPEGSQQGDTPPSGSPGGSDDLTASDEWRHPEYLVIRETPKDDFLSATDPGIHEELAAHFGRVRSVNVLRETRALRGFTRVRDDVLKLNVGKALLRRESLPPEEDWLPGLRRQGRGNLPGAQRRSADRVGIPGRGTGTSRHARQPLRSRREPARATTARPHPAVRHDPHAGTPAHQRADLHLRIQLRIAPGTLVCVRGGRPGDGRTAHLHRSR